MPEPSPVPDPTPVPEPTPVEPTPDPIPVTPEPDPHPGPDFVEHTTVIPTVDADASAGDQAVGAPLFADETDQAAEAEAPKERREVTLPALNARIAVIVSGLVVGLVGVVLSWGAGQGCEAVRGVGSCGGVGLFALLAVVAIQVLVGAALLRAWKITDPTSTSFLGVGLVAVMALLFFLGSLESIWMLLVIPVLTAITFLISWWVTETFVEQGSGDNIHR